MISLCIFRVNGVHLILFIVIIIEVIVVCKLCRLMD